MNDAAKEILDKYTDPWRTEQILDDFRHAGLAIYKQKRSFAPGVVTSEPMTPELREAIKNDLIATDLSGMQIATKHNVNIGRVSEVRTQLIIDLTS